MQKRPLAVVTMTYNEAVMLPLWLRHYARQVGIESCHVIDHGSDDGSTAGLDANVVRLPRTPLNEWERAHTVRDFCASLLIGYRHVLYVDADELVVADPDVAADLNAYVASHALPPVGDLFGCDVIHADGEPDLDLSRPVSEQRGVLRPLSTLCKPTLVSGRVDWHIGFHCLIQDHRPTFGDLYLFHLAHCDNRTLFERQKKRNAAAPVGIADSHHAIDPHAFLDHVRNDISRFPRRSVAMRHGEPAFEEVKTLFADAIEGKGWAQSPALWDLPRRFVGAF